MPTQVRERSVTQPQAPGMPGPGRIDISESWLFLALAGIVVGFWIWGGSGFFALENFRNILFDTSVIAMLAIGMAYLIIAGHFDLSVGSILIFSSVVAAKVMVALAGTTEQVQAGIYPHATRCDHRRHPRRDRRGSGLGDGQRLPRGQARPAVVHRHARHAGRGAEPRAGAQRRRERLATSRRRSSRTSADGWSRGSRCW